MSILGPTMVKQLPTLPQMVRRRLLLKWTELVELGGFTGCHLDWPQTRRRKLKPRPPVTLDGSFRPRSDWRKFEGDRYEPEDSVGERETIDLATGRFVQVVSEYFAIWAEYEDGLSDEFSGWLPALRDLVLNEVGDLWKGRGDWFERVCVQKLNTPSTDREPSRDKGKFAPIMNEWSAKARSVEMARINSAALTPNKLRTSGDGQRFGDTWKSTDQVEFQSPHSADTVIRNSGPRPQPPVDLTVQASTGVTTPTRSLSERDSLVHSFIGPKRFREMTNAEIARESSVKKQLKNQFSLSPDDDATKCILDRIRHAMNYPLSNEIKKNRSSRT